MQWRFRPARDLGLPMAERLRSQSREPGLFGLATHTAWSLAVECYLSAFHRLAVRGRANLPDAPPFVMIANHASHLDALSLGAALPRGLSWRAFVLAAGEVFFDKLPAAGFAAFAVNALPVWRQRTTPAELALLRQRLIEDELVFILFPEGTRSRTGEMGRFRAGIGALVAGSPVPVVPCFLAGTHAAWPPHRRLPRPLPVSLEIGAPMAFQDTPNNPAGWLAVAAACESAVRGLGAAVNTPRASGTSTTRR
jgi:1-acyl-sn-glycerol-3-phosphate acyltransferase